MQLSNRIDQLLFAKHLSMMLGSGVPILEALSALELGSKSFRGTARVVREGVENGLPLHESLSRASGKFSPLFVNLVKVGESTGTLGENLSYIAGRLGKEYALRKRISGMLLYPAIILAVSVLVGGFIAVFIFPKLLRFLDSFQVELPAITKALLSIVSTMQSSGPIIVFVGVTTIVLLRVITALPIVKPIWHRLLLFLPIAGPLLRNIAFSSIFRDLGLLIGRGVPIEESFNVEKSMTRNLAIRSYVERLGAAVSGGKRLSDEIGSGSYPLLPSMAVGMIASGERTGKLGESFLYLADYFEDEVDTSAKTLSTMLEPILIVIMAAVVGFIAFAVILPMYSLTGSIHR